METDPKLHTLNIFTELLQRLWQRLSLLIGQTAVAAICSSAQREIAHDHPMIKHLEVTGSGIEVENLRRELHAYDQNAIKAAFLAYIDSIIDLLGDLTGGILVGKIEDMLNELNQTAEDK
jgi:GTPase